MKKNKVMRFASVVLVMTLLSTCMVGGTFAKYTTSATSGDSARVAYWGFDQGADLGIDLFDGEYTNVKSGNTDNVIAPGTSKSDTFAFGYTPATDANALNAGAISAPEVAYTFTVAVENATGVKYDALDNNPNFVWTLQKGTEAATTYQEFDDLAAAIEALSGDASGTKQYNAGQLPAAFTSADEVYTIGWEWKFETTGAGMAAQDSADTAMGAALTELDNVNFTITITATQID